MFVTPANSYVELPPMGIDIPEPSIATSANKYALTTYPAKVTFLLQLLKRVVALTSSIGLV